MKKSLGTLVTVAALLASASLCADLPQPYASIRNLPATPYYVQDAYTFFNLANTHNAAVIVDVGSQDGSVARYFAQQASNLPSLKQIYSIDLWESSDASQAHLFQRFLSNVIQENSTGLIVPIRMSSHEAAESLNVQADFINLAGSHDQNTVYHDIISWHSHLSNGGVLAGNDWYDTAVESAVTQAAATLGISVQVNGNVWYFTK